MKKNILLCILFVFSYSINSAQITFQKTYGLGREGATNMGKTSDGGYIMVGGADFHNTGYPDLYLVKVDSIGNLEWEKAYGGLGYDYGWSVIQNFEGGYTAVGATTSFGHNNLSFFVKTDSLGNLLQSKVFGDTNSSTTAYSIKQTNDSGYAFFGYAYNNSIGNYFSLLIRTNKDGDTLWTKTYTSFGGRDILGQAIIQTNDSGFILGGMISSFSGDIGLIRIDKDGNPIWTKSIGIDSTFSGYFKDIQETFDGGYIILSGFLDNIYLVKTDSVGNIIWSRTFGGNGTYRGNSVKQTVDTGFVIVGGTTSFASSEDDASLIKTNSLGNLLWSKNYGGTGRDEGYAVYQTKDDGYMIAGVTHLSGGVFLIKTDLNGNVDCYVSDLTTVESTPISHDVDTIVSIGFSNYAADKIITTDTGGVENILCYSNSINEENKSHKLISIFPNPAVRQCNIYSPNFIIQDMEVFNMIGEKFFSKYNVRSNVTEIDVSVFPKGIYFLKVSNGEIIFTDKFIVE